MIGDSGGRFSISNVSGLQPVMEISIGFSLLIPQFSQTCFDINDPTRSFAPVTWCHVAVLFEAAVKTRQCGKSGLMGNFSDQSVTLFQGFAGCVNACFSQIFTKTQSRALVKQAAQVFGTDAKRAGDVLQVQGLGMMISNMRAYLSNEGRQGVHF